MSRSVSQGDPPSIVVVGSSNTDLTLTVPRLPQPGETILGRGGYRVSPGGKGANQAVAACRAGRHEVRFLAAIGDDDYGSRALAVYHEEGINTSGIARIKDRSSGVAFILVDERGENQIVVAPGANAALTADHIAHAPDEAFRPGGVLLASLEVPLDAVAAAIHRAGEAGMTIILNPAPAPDELSGSPLLREVDVLTPNRSEAARIAGMDPEADPKAIARALIDIGPSVVIITRGAAGCLYAERGSGAEPEILDIPAHPVEAVDTVGAGDAFSGAVAVGLSEGLRGRALVRFAAVAGALATTAPGAQDALPTRAAIDAILSGTD